MSKKTAVSLLLALFVLCAAGIGRVMADNDTSLQARNESLESYAHPEYMTRSAFDREKYSLLAPAENRAFRERSVHVARPAFERTKYSGAIAAAREEMWKVITTGHGSGATIAIMDRGRFVMAEGIGTAERAANRPVDINTRFNIGSTSKMFVAVAILLLVDDGKIGLDEPVAKYIPEFTMKDPRYKDITVRMLFNHSSGLPGSTFYFGYEIDRGMHKMLLDTLAYSYLKHDPGAMSIYCNDGFTLAEIVVERMSGEKYLDFLARRIFKPLGMKNTGASVGEIQHENTAEFYDSKTGKKYPREVVMVYGAGGLSSTASDMCRFCNSFTPYGKKILSEASLREISRPQPSGFADKLNGLQICGDFGWDYSVHPALAEKGFHVMAKSGGSSYYTTYFQLAPEHGLIVAFSICGHVAGTEAISRRIFEALLRDVKLLGPEAEAIRKPAEAQAIPEKFSSYAGFYTSDTAVIKVSFDMKNKKCDAISAGDEDSKPVFSLIFDGEYFVDNDKNLKYYFTTIGGESYIVAHKMAPYGCEWLSFQKLREIKEPKKLKADINGKKWLMRNAKPGILGNLIAIPTSVAYAGLPGYIDFSGLKKIETADYAGIAATAFRDQFALELMDKNGEIWAGIGGFTFTMADNAKKAGMGLNRTFIGKENHDEWLKIEKGAILSFEKPKNGRIVVFSPGDEPVYDSVVDSGEVYAPAGSFVFFAGEAGDLFKTETK